MRLALERASELSIGTDLYDVDEDEDDGIELYDFCIYFLRVVI